MSIPRACFDVRSCRKDVRRLGISHDERQVNEGGKSNGESAVPHDCGSGCKRTRATSGPRPRQTRTTTAADRTSISGISRRIDGMGCPTGSGAVDNLRDVGTSERHSCAQYNLFGWSNAVQPSWFSRMEAGAWRVESKLVGRNVPIVPWLAGTASLTSKQIRLLLEFLQRGVIRLG